MIDLEGQNKTALSDYKFIDLFCGIGGFHLALESFGAQCVFASDINLEARKVYEKNHNIAPHGDITKIPAEEIPEHDILCAGFPCQAFSISGKGNGFSDKNTGKLFFEINRVLKMHRPKIILLENVANLEIHWNGYTINHILRTLRARGYTPYKAILNAFEFGIPQFRRRLYIVAFRDDIGISEFAFPKELQIRIPLREKLLVAVDESCYISQPFHIRDNYEQLEKATRTPYLRIGETGLGRQGERIYSTKGCATTLSSTSGGPGGRTGMYYINGRVRKLSPRECARLMGFPDTFEMAQTANQAYQQFGNSVVVDVLQYIIIEIVKNLRGENNGKKEH